MGYPNGRSILAGRDGRELNKKNTALTAYIPRKTISPMR